MDQQAKVTVYYYCRACREIDTQDLRTTELDGPPPCLTCGEPMEETGEEQE